MRCIFAADRQIAGRGFTLATVFTPTTVRTRSAVVAIEREVAVMPGESGAACTPRERTR